VAGQIGARQIVALAPKLTLFAAKEMVRMALVTLAPHDCQMSKPKMKIWVNFGRILQWKMLVYFMTIWSIHCIWHILWPFGIFYGYLVHFTPFW
jgi:hypothetical protein